MLAENTFTTRLYCINSRKMTLILGRCLCFLDNQRKNSYHAPYLARECGFLQHLAKPEYLGALKEASGDY